MDSDWRDTISTKNRYVIRCRRKKEKEREKELSSTFINTAYIHDRESDGTVEILIAISHGYRRQPIFPWWSVEDSWEEKRERNIRGASAIVILLIVKTTDCLFSREREREWKSRRNSRNDIDHVRSCVRCIPCVGPKGAQGQVEWCPFPPSTVTRRVISVVSMGWEIVGSSKSLLRDIKEGSGNLKII